MLALNTSNGVSVETNLTDLQLTKKTRQTKALPLETEGYVNKKFLTAPVMAKHFQNLASILNVSPINIKNIPANQYETLFDQSLINLKNGSVSTPEEETHVTGQIGFTVHFRGCTDDIHLLYGFDPSWVTKESSFKTWFKEKYDSDSLCLVSDNVRGWGKTKIDKMLSTINEKLDNISKSDSVELEISGDTTFVPSKKVLKLRHCLLVTYLLK